MSRVSLARLPLAFVAGCASADDEGPSLPASLEGAYFAETGTYSWVGFRGDEFVSVANTPACNVAEPPSSCLEEGHWAFGAGAGELRLTPNGAAAKTISIVIREIKPRAELVASQSVELVKGDKELLSPNVVTKFSLVDKQKELLQEAELQKVLILCRVIGLALNPPSQPVIVPPTPPPIVREQQCAGASSKG